MWIKAEILYRIQEIIDNYKMEKKVLVAYSGGKDSFFSCIALKELGIEVVPVIIDIGFGNDWKIQIDHLLQFGLKPEVIDRGYLKSFSQWKYDKQIEEYFIMTKENVKKGLTPCTPCYNAKVLMLQYIAEKKEIKECVFGHHGTDAVTSLLKSYFMYQDKFVAAHNFFDLNVFQNLVKEYEQHFMVPVEVFKQSFVYKNLNEMIKIGLVGTDEPIRQKYGNMYIIRPLFGILESEIMEIVNNSGLTFSKAECFQSGVRDSNKMTPREFIQKTLLSNVKMNQGVIKLLLELIRSNLNEDGSMKFDVRRNRTKLLGSSYENNLQSCVKL